MALRYTHPAGTGQNYTTWQLIKDIAYYLKPYKGLFFVASVLRLIGDLANLFPAYALAYTINFVTHFDKGEPLTPLWTVLAVWWGLYMLRSWVIFGTKYFGFSVAERVSLDAQIRSLRHMIKLDINWHEKENSGNKLKRIENGGVGFLRVIRIWLVNIIEIIVNLVGMTFIVSQFDLVISLIMIAFLLSYYTISYFTIKPAARAAYGVSVNEEILHGIFFELLNNIRTVKVMRIASSLLNIASNQIGSLMHTVNLRITRFQSRASLLSSWGYSFRILCLIVAILGVINGKYEIGFIVLFVGYFDRLWESVRELSDISQDIIISRQSISRMNDILNEPVLIDDETNKTPFPKDWQTITAQNVSFSYGDNEVLKNISFIVKRGQKVGIVGLSGAGKSTLFKLLLKEHEPSSGQILIDNTPLTSISKQDFFNYLSVVFQETEVFNYSLKDNITMVNAEEQNNNELLAKAIDVAHVTDYLSKLPQGLDTTIGEKGVKLSGGEKQRLGIARAIFKEPQILLLDEATSHLDLESEEKIRDSLHAFFENVTAIVIAHRLTTIKEMDTILVIEHGTLIEAGDFDSLYNKKGRFYELWEKQRL